MPTWIIFGILSAFFAALVTIFSKKGLANIDSNLATTVRVIVMSLFLIVFSALTGKFAKLNTINGNALLFIVLGALAGVISWLFYFYALSKADAGQVQALDRLSLVFVVILAGIFLSEKIDLRLAVGSILMVLGAILMVKSVWDKVIGLFVK